MGRSSRCSRCDSSTKTSCGSIRTSIWLRCQAVPAAPPPPHHLAVMHQRSSGRPEQHPPTAHDGMSCTEFERCADTRRWPPHAQCRSSTISRSLRCSGVRVQLTTIAKQVLGTTSAASCAGPRSLDRTLQGAEAGVVYTAGRVWAAPQASTPSLSRTAMRKGVPHCKAAC